MRFGILLLQLVAKLTRLACVTLRVVLTYHILVLALQTTGALSARLLAASYTVLALGTWLARLAINATALILVLSRTTSRTGCLARFALFVRVCACITIAALRVPLEALVWFELTVVTRNACTLVVLLTVVRLVRTCRTALTSVTEVLATSGLVPTLGTCLTCRHARAGSDVTLGAVVAHIIPSRLGTRRGLKLALRTHRALARIIATAIRLKLAFRASLTRVARMVSGGRDIFTARASQAC